MARARNIKPGLFKNEILGTADPLYTILFEGLWILADREGRLENRPLRIKAEIFPYREGLDIVAMLGWLEDNSFIQRYSVKGESFIQILKFSKHQNPHKNEAASAIPSMDEADKTESVVVPIKSEALGLIPDSLNSDSLNSDCGVPADDQQADQPTKPKRMTRLPTNFELTDDMTSAAVTYWEAKKRADLSVADQFEKFIAHHESRGSKMASWEAAWKTWYCKAPEFNRPEPGHGANKQTSFQSAADRRAAVAAETYEYKRAIDF